MLSTTHELVEECLSLYYACHAIYLLSLSLGFLSVSRTLSVKNFRFTDVNQRRTYIEHFASLPPAVLRIPVTGRRSHSSKKSPLIIELASHIWRRFFPARSRRTSGLLLPRITPTPAMDINPFRMCSGLRVVGYFMILIVLAVVLLSYYAVVVLTWGPHLLDGGFDSFLSFTIIITFHILLVMLMWSYIKVVIQDPGSVPENWKLVSEQNIEKGNSVAWSDYASIENPTPTLSTEQIERRQSQSRGYCSKCQNGKPPRCHHCSVCQRCVLKMDHHCIWVVNCVGARNYKFFLLFVVYTFLTTTLDTLVLLPSFVKFFRQAKNHSLSPGNIAVIFLVFVLNLAFSLSLLCFVIMHASLLSSNTTSVEVYEKKNCPRWKYDLGWKRNFEQVFGANKALWFFPLFSKKDLENIPALHGMEFPTRSDAVE